MANWVKFFVFIALVAITVFVTAVNFAKFVIFGIILLASIIYYANINENFAGWIGEAMNATGRNNNLRFYVLIGLIVLIFIAGIKYGGGEPVLLSSLRETKELLSPLYDGDKQATVNSFVYGINANNEIIKNDKELAQWAIKQGKKDGVKNLPPTRMIPITSETPEIYNQKIKNLAVYGIFTIDVDREKFITSAQDEWNKERPWYSYLNPWYEKEYQWKTISNALEYPRYKKTWFFWKLLFVFLIMTILYFPFTIADEVIDFIDKRLEEIKARLISDSKSETPTLHAPTPITAPTGGVPTGGWLASTARIVSIDALMEVFYAVAKRLLEQARR